MKPAVNGTLNFIHTAGVRSIAQQVRGGEIGAPRALEIFKVMGSAIDAYAATMPEDTSLARLQRSFADLPEGETFSRLRVRAMSTVLSVNCEAVESAVRFRVDNIEAIGGTAVKSAVATASVAAPQDLSAHMWRWIPPGEFWMGAKPDDSLAQGREKEGKIIMTGGFYILSHPATNGQYRQFLRAKGRRDSRTLRMKFSRDDYPAVMVGITDQIGCSRWMGKELSGRVGLEGRGDLPTEIEWERAAKGRDGEEFTKAIVRPHYQINKEGTRAVNDPMAKANTFGLTDVIGNVFEVTCARTGSKEERIGSYILRGASWMECSAQERNIQVRASFGVSISLETVSLDIGFRPIFVPKGFYRVT